MKTREVRLVHQSSAPADKIAHAFREAAEAAYDGSGSRKLAHNTLGRKVGSRFEFFTPDTDDPFAQVSEQPVFSVGVKMPAGGVFNSAMPVGVHMYVYDDGLKRRAELVGLYENRGLKGRVEALVGDLQQALPD